MATNKRKDAEKKKYYAKCHEHIDPKDIIRKKCTKIYSVNMKYGHTIYCNTRGCRNTLTSGYGMRRWIWLNNAHQKFWLEHTHTHLGWS